MKSLARKISQGFGKDSNGYIRSIPTDNVNHSNALKKKKSIKDMMVDTFMNPFSYIKNGSANNNSILLKNNVSEKKYSTFTRPDYESVFNKPIEKSDPSRLIYVPKSLMEENIDEVSDSNTVNSKGFNEVPVKTPKNENQTSPDKEEEDQSEQTFSPQDNNETSLSEEKEDQSFDTLYSDSESGNKLNENNSEKDETSDSCFSWSFLRSKLSFSKSDVDTFCNNNKLTSYDRYENYCSGSETDDISEDETAIELQVFSHDDDNKINEKYLVPEPEINEKELVPELEISDKDIELEPEINTDEQSLI